MGFSEKEYRDALQRFRQKAVSSGLIRPEQASAIVLVPISEGMYEKLAAKTNIERCMCARCLQSSQFYVLAIDHRIFSPAQEDALVALYRTGLELPATDHGQAAARLMN